MDQTDGGVVNVNELEDLKCTLGVGDGEVGVKKD